MKLNFSLNRNLVSRMVNDGKIKGYEDFEKIMTRYFFPAETLKDFLDEKYSIKRQIIQWIIVIFLWIAPIKWLIELIAYQTYGYRGPSYYTSYFGMALGQDEVSFTCLGILIIFSGNYYHSFCKLIL